MSLPIEIELGKRSFREGFLFVSVALQTDNDVREERGNPNRIWLRTSVSASSHKDYPLFAHFFRVDDRNPRDSLLKTATNLLVIPVQPNTSMSLVLNTEVLTARLNTTGTGKERRGRFDILVGLGPLIAKNPKEKD